MLRGSFGSGVARTILLVSLIFSAFPVVAGTWAPVPDEPILNPAKINFNGGQEDAGSTLAVGDGAAIAISAASLDKDQLTDGSTVTLELDGAQIVWTCSSGTLTANRTDTGISTTWTAPTLGPSEDSRTVTLTAKPDDDSTTNPGGPLNGHSGNRNDTPATGITLTIVVTKLCTITKITSNEYVPIGDDITLTAHGANLSTVEWSAAGADPDNGTGVTFTTKWRVSGGSKTVTATCGSSTKSKTVKVVEVTAITVESGATDTNVTTPVGSPKNWAAVKKPGHLVIVKATTNPDEAGAWEYIQWTGGSAVTGAKNKRSVSKDASAKTNVKAACGTSSAELNVWILWATVTNKVTGTTPANAVQFGTRYDGTENLGAQSYTEGGVEYAVGKVVPWAQLTPAGVHDVVKSGWEFKRDKFRHDFMDGAQWAARFDTAWQPDDSDDSLQNETPDNDDRIYDRDAPNISRFGATDSVERYDNYREYVYWNSDMASDYAIWHWKARYKVGQTPPVTLKEVGDGEMTLPNTAHYPPPGP